MNKNELTTKQVAGLMILAYLFSFMVRMIWVWQFKDNPSFYWNGELMINTNDGYFFGSGAQKALFGLHETNPRVPDIWSYGVTFFTYWVTKLTPFSLETVMLYMPAVVSSLVVIPVILIARLYKRTLWGFLSALLGSIAWSYYNRTMVGYYDTDMFSAMAPMFILYFLMKGTVDFNLRSALYAAVAIVIYPFLYDQGRVIVYAMGLIYAAYMIWYHRREKVTYESLILVFLALVPFGILSTPWNYILHLIVVLGAYAILRMDRFGLRALMITSAVLFVAFFLLGDVAGLIWRKMYSYLITGTQESGLHFYAVNQTVREAGHIPFSTFANRISGSQLGVVISLIGYIVLVMRHRAFLLALPLVGIGIFALWGGLRFTVYAVPIAAMSAVYLFFVIGEFFKDKKLQYAFAVLATAAMIYPNIKHIIAYRVPTVFKNAEVRDLAKLDKIADTKDYTLTWWDYGYPIWFYSDTNTLIDGGKHNNDNFIVSTILQTDSPELAARLSRVAVETYVASNYKVVADVLFKNRQKDQRDPNLVLSEIESGAYPIPQKTREIYLYMPLRMMHIFPTIMKFGNLDLTTGKKKRNVMFYPTSAKKSEKGKLFLRNGFVFDMKKGELSIRNRKLPVKLFVTTQLQKSGDVRTTVKPYHRDGSYVVVYLKSYGSFIVMDEKTFKSMYVQMFMLGKYDKRFFEPVMTSPYSRIYRLKI